MRACSVGLALVSIAVGACGWEGRDGPHPAEKEQAFSNHFSGLPIHEQITVGGLSFLRTEVKNFLAATNAAFDLANVFVADAHFDNCTFAATSQRIRNNYHEAVENALDFPTPFQCPDYDLSSCDVLTTGAAALRNFAEVL